MKRKLKTGLSLLLTVVLVIGMSVPVFADKDPGKKVGDPSQDGKTTIVLKNIEGKDIKDAERKYQAYRLLILDKDKLGDLKKPATKDEYETYGYEVNPEFRETIKAAIEYASENSEVDKVKKFKGKTTDAQDDTLLDMISDLDNAKDIRNFADKAAELLKEQEGTKATSDGNNVTFTVEPGYYLIIDKSDVNGKEGKARSLAMIFTKGTQYITVNTK